MKALKQGKYPYSKIIIYYVLIIGLVNAFALEFISVLMFKNETLVEVPFIFLVFSFFITTSPAFIFLSIWLCYKKYVFHQINDIYSLMKKSLFSFMVYLFFNLMIVWEKFVYSKANIIFIGISIVLFVLLSTLTLYQILPKTGKYHHQKRHRAKIKHRNKIRHALSPNQDTVPEENLVSESILKENEIQSFNFSEFYCGFKSKFLNPTTMENDPYPTVKVILSFLVLGSAMSAILFTLLSAFLALLIFALIYMIALIMNEILTGLIIILVFLAYAFAIGFSIALLPNLIISLILSSKKVYLKTAYDYTYLFIIGHIASILQLLILLPLYRPILQKYNLFNSYSSVIILIFIESIIVGISAVIVSRFALPKAKQNETTYFQNWSEK